jgi:hypothetical protein
VLTSKVGEPAGVLDRSWVGQLALDVLGPRERLGEAIA